MGIKRIGEWSDEANGGKLKCGMACNTADVRKQKD